jgi:uncharacterized DUF497 family protein
MASRRLGLIRRRRAAHIERHTIELADIQDAWDNDPNPYVRLMSKGPPPRLAVLARVPSSGTLIFILVERRKDGGVEVVTARRATLSERRRYEKA